MKFALVNNERKEPQPNLEGICLSCGSPMVARCGEVRIKHWAHKGIRRCDPWWENETEWHRNWKNQFSSDWQEIVHHAENGEKHIADVKTKEDWIIEFQHSYIKPEERRSREAFYQKLIWVVDGNRRLGDKKRFFGILGDSLFNKNYPELKSTFPEGALLRDWIQSKTHVFFDFGEEDLWWLLSGSDEYWAFILPISRSKFLEFHRNDDLIRNNEFDALVEKYKDIAPKPIKSQHPRVESKEIHPNELLMLLRVQRRYRKQ
jgi:competence protein CoiA